jgi:outer membrane beta-barrel protein
MGVTYKRFATFALVLSVVFCCAAPAAAEDDAEEARSYSSLVVQNREFNPTHEFYASVGLLPLDAFTKGVTLSGSYTLHFSELIGWEILQFGYSFQYDTDLQSDLEALDVGPTPFEVLDYYASTNLLYKPVYWKGSVLNDSLLRGELYTLIGGAYGWFTRSNRPGVNIGGGLRLFKSELLSFRFDMRYYWFFDETLFENFEFKDELSINFGASLAF